MLNPKLTKLSAPLLASLALLSPTHALAQAAGGGSGPSINIGTGFQVAPSEPGPLLAEPMSKDAQALLDSLKVNIPTEGKAVAVPARRERAVTLSSTTSTSVNLVLGSAKTLVLPGAFDKATLVVPDVADLVPLTTGRMQVMARQAGTTDVVFTNTTTGETFRAQIMVTLDAAPVQAALKAALPGERILVTAVNNALVLSGNTRDAAAAATAVAIAKRFVNDAAGVINQVQVMGGQQVMLKVRVAEVNRTATKSLGLNTGMTYGTKAGSKVGGVFGNAPAMTQYGLTGDGAMNPLGAIGSISGGNPVAFISSRMLGGVLSSTISALEAESLVRTLAEPNLVAMSGKTAQMLAGATYPVPTIGDNGNMGTEYRPFGVQLSFTPTVMSPGSIGLDIQTEVSSRGQDVEFPAGQNGTATMPVFNIRKAQTSIELPSGGTIAIAGLLSTEMKSSMSGLPGVSNLPILGRLFSSQEFQRDESELVILVTAYLVEPTDAQNPLASPGDGLVAPSDADIYFLNRLTGSLQRRQAPPPASISRSVGFITE